MGCNISAVDLSGTSRIPDGFQQAPETSHVIEMWPNPIGQGKGRRSAADPQRENVQTPTVVPHLTGFLWLWRGTKRRQFQSNIH